MTLSINASAAVKRTALSKPNFKVNSETGEITWKKVRNAVSYSVRIRGKNIAIARKTKNLRINAKKLFLKHPGEKVKIYVRADAKSNSKFKTSSWNIIRYTIPDYTAENLFSSEVVPEAGDLTEVSPEQIIPLFDKKVIEAFKTLNFKIFVNPKVAYRGLFELECQSITLKALDDTAYHEMGHFLDWLIKSYSFTSEFKKIYQEEKSKFSGPNNVYALQSSSEYFAEAVREYYLRGSALKRACPKTYDAINRSLEKVTPELVQFMGKVLRAQLRIQ